MNFEFTLQKVQITLKIESTLTLINILLHLADV